MSKEQVQEEATLAVDTREDQEQEPLYWESLVDLKNDIAETIIRQQAFILEINKQNIERLQKDPDALAMLEGLMLSLSDLAKETAEIFKAHSDEQGNIVTGKVEGIDEQMKYLSIANQYITIHENIISTTNNVYLDVFTRLNLDHNLLNQIKETIAAGQTEVKEVVDGTESK